jgi:folate-binding protein YgfZ
VALDGPEAAGFLQGQCTQDVENLTPGAHRWALLLAPDGKVVVLVRVLRVSQEQFFLDCAGGFGEMALARLERFKLRSKVAITAWSDPGIALRGEQAQEATAGWLGLSPGALSAQDVAVERGGNWVFGYEWNGVRGVDVLGADPSVAVPTQAQWCTDTAWEALRVEAGIPAMGKELDERTIPAEAGLLDATVSFTKGCYTGQELVARLESRGNRVARRLRGVVLLDAHPGIDGASGVVGAALYHEGSQKAAGVCTSAAWCPGLGAVAALAYVHRSVPVPGRVRVEVPDRPTQRWAAEVRELPLR